MTFHPRQRIQHKTLGAGTVVDVDGVRAAYPRGLRFLVPQTVGKLTGWRYSAGTPYLEPGAER